MWATTTLSFDVEVTDLYLDPKQHYAYSKLNPIEQFIGVLRGIPDSISGSDNEYLLDALGPTLSETGRFGYVVACMGEKNPVYLAMCAADVDRLDRDKVRDEVRTANGSGAAKTKIRLLLWMLDGKLATYRDRVKKAREEPAYAKMFDIAAATSTEWDQVWKSERPLVDLALAMDDARESRSKKALDGCADKTRAAWKNAVAAIPAKSFIGTDAEHWAANALEVITGTPTGYLAAVALYSCGSADRDKDHLFNGLSWALYRRPGLRGPRLATAWAIMNAGLQLDEIGAEIKYPNVRHDTRFKAPLGRGNFYGYSGVVAKVSKPDKSGMATIVFSTKTEKQEQCIETKQSKHISGIRDNGSIEYERDCVKWGVVTIDKTPDNKIVDARYLEAVKPGVIVYADAGVVFGVFPKGKKTPIVVTGVPVK